jgi:hypothetical protein
VPFPSKVVGAGGLATRVLALATALLAWPAAAQVGNLPRSLGRAALDDAQPFSFEPLGLRVEDFALVAEPATGPQPRARFVPGSLRWVRVSPFLVVPRALAVIEADGARGGTVRYAGTAHPLRVRDGAARAELPVALLSADRLPLIVAVRDGAGGTRSVAFRIRFVPRPRQRAGVAFDSSCSPYAPRVLAGAPPPDSFLYVGCRIVHGGAGDGTRATLELMLVFAHAGDDVRIEGVPAEPRSPELFTVRLDAAAQGVTVAARGQRVALAFRVPPRLHDGFLGVGFGPYLYDYEEDGYALRAPIGLLTLYAGYSFTASTRIVYFNASALHRRGFADSGFYLWLEQARFVDQRMSFNLLLGANLLVHSRALRPVVRLSAPQGFELVVRDLFGRARSMTFGAFLYPKLFDRSYYNLWLRWGSAAFFAEINFIAWEEPGGRGGVRSRSLGLSFGTPIVRFL